MRIAWVQDNSRPHGGAEMSNRCVVSVGESLGFDIVGVTPQRFLVKAIEECDLIILNNLFEFLPDQMNALSRFLWEVRKPYVKYEHDNREHGRPEFARRLFGESVLNVFLSPSHLARHREALGIEGIALPLAIQTDMFRSVRGVDRDENKALFVGGLGSRGKAGSSCIRYMQDHPRLSFVSVGFDLPGATTIPKRPLSEMPALFSSVGRLVHLPDKFWAGERIVFEAALCGVNVVMNEKVGHASWGRDLTDTEGLREWLRQAPFDFWKAVVAAVPERKVAC